MALIIAIVLAIIILIKVGSDKVNSAEYERKRKLQQDTRASRMASWRAEAGHAALEEDLRYFILEPQNYDKVWDEVHSAYLHMPLHKGIQSIQLNSYTVEQYYGKGVPKKHREEIAAENRLLALHIMLARRGKVLLRYTETDLKVDSFAPGVGEKTKRDWDEKYEFWSYIYEELLRQGVNARLLFIRNVAAPTKDNPNQRREIACEYGDTPRYEPGYIQWFQQTTFTDDLKEKL